MVLATPSMRARALMAAFLTAAIAACGSNVAQQSSSTGGDTGGAGTTSTTSASAGGASTTASSSSGTGGAPSTSASSASSSTTTSSSSSSTTSSSTSTSSSSSGGNPDLLAELKAGPWMFGWSGGLDHYSWVRFNFVNATQGSVDVLDAKCTSCTGYWSCQGVGLFSADPQALSLVLQLPAGCNNQGHQLVFQMFDATSGFPQQATRRAALTDDGNAIEGYRYPPSFCDAAFKTCGDPFQ